jgi:hypothetical protein
VTPRWWTHREVKVSLEVNTPGESKFPGGEYTGESRLPRSEDTEESPLDSNNSSIVVLKYKIVS